jgi:hypothetical protein
MTIERIPSPAVFEQKMNSTCQITVLSFYEKRENNRKQCEGQFMDD